MTREVHDAFAKDVLSMLLEPFGDVEPEQVIPSESVRTDLLFRSRRVPIDREIYGMVAVMAESDALFEAYRNPVGDDHLITCMSKLCLTRQEERRDKRRKTHMKELTDRPRRSALWSGLHPRLWVITPSCTHGRLEAFGFRAATGTYPAGYFSLAPGWRYGLVVVNLLPEVPNTLFLRLLGRGKVQTRAIQELFTLPEDHPLRRNLLQIGRRWLTLFREHRPRTLEDKELFMNLQGTFEEWERDIKEQARVIGEQAREQGREQWLEQGLEQGREEGREQGREQGVLIGKILALSEILDQMPISSEDLKDRSLEQLERMLQELRSRLRS